jgi:hypothetical protein
MYIFCEVLLYSGTKKSIKEKRKSNVKRGLAERPKRNKRLGKRDERQSLRVFGQCILLFLQLNLIYYRSGCGRRQIAEPPKIMFVICFCFILSSYSLQRTENLRAVRFDAVPLLPEKIPPTGAI